MLDHFKGPYSSASVIMLCIPFIIQPYKDGLNGLFVQFINVLENVQNQSMKVRKWMKPTLN